MSGVVDSAVCVRVPTGPFAWLFPELAGADDDVGALDVADAVARRASTLLVPIGPFGRTLRRALVQRLRGTATSVRFDADRRDGAQRLDDAARAAAPGTVLQANAAGEWTVCPGDLAELLLQRAAAAADGPLPPWVLPLCGDGGPLALVQRALAAVERVGAEAAAAAELIPCFVDDAAMVGDDATTRRPESWWGVLPGDRCDAELRAAMQTLIERLWPQRAAAWRAFVDLALGGHDLYLEQLLGRALATAAAPAARRPLLLGFCGIDGAGKSSQLQALGEWLRARGLRTAVVKFYRHGVFHATVTDVARRCAGDHHLHLWRLERIAKLFDSRKCMPAIQRVLREHDVVLFDRSIWTHHAAGTGRSHHDPFARELLAGMPVPHRTFLLDLPIEVSVARLGTRSERTIDENPYMLGRYRAMLLALAQRHGFVVLDARAPLAASQATIRAEVERLLA